MTVGSQLGVAQMEPDTQPLRLVEQRLGLCAWHVALEEREQLVVGEVPAGKEGRERELGKHDELGAAPRGLAEHREQPSDHVRARLGAPDRTHLRGGNRELPAHRASAASRNSTCNSTFAPASRSASAVSSAGL